MEDRVRDPFDRLLGSIDGLPDVHKSRPSTITSVVPMLGDTETHVVQSYSTEEGVWLLVQRVDASGGQRFVLPPKVTAAIYRQRESLVKAGRRARGRDRWASMSPSEQDAAVRRLRGK